MKSPAFQFYPSDYTSSQRVRLLTLEEEGAYINLLCSCWLHGSIPADPEMAARLIGKGASTTLATTVLTMFVPSSEPGRLVHDRLEAERSKQADWRAKSSAGGKKSAENRKGGSRVVQPPLADGTNQTSTLQSSVFSLQSSKDKDKGGDDSPMPEKKFNAAEASIPSAIDSPEFRAAWADWCQYRRESGHTMKSRTAHAQLAEMAGWGKVESIAAIRQSIRQGWRGVFKPDGRQSINGAQKSEFADAF